jgi:hypothetical protein
MELKILGVWVEIPVVDDFPPRTRSDGTFRADMRSIGPEGQFYFRTESGSVLEAYLTVTSVTCPSHPGNCSIEQSTP